MGGADGLQLPPGPSPWLHLSLAARHFGCVPARHLRRAAAAGGLEGGVVAGAGSGEGKRP